MEAVVKRSLKTEILTPFGRSGGGCINEGRSFVTDGGSKIYVKYKADKEVARRMFEGEFTSLDAIRKSGKIRVPEPVVVEDYPEGSLLIMEHLELRSLRPPSSAALGTQLAQLHLYNQDKLKESFTDSFVGRHQHEKSFDKFGFDVTTCCGFLPLQNEWNDDWVRFYCSQRLDPQMNMEEVKCDRVAQELWKELQRKIPSFFKGMEILPALLHGDLWSGNVSEIPAPAAPGVNSDSPKAAIPVIYDPASFYGHDEFEFGIVNMFGGFDRQFFDAYHSIIPPKPGHEPRQRLYQLFHRLNHWNHFGSGYRQSSLSLMKELLKN